jgi:hypothetical protein
LNAACKFAVAGSVAGRSHVSGRNGALIVDTTSRQSWLPIEFAVMTSPVKTKSGVKGKPSRPEKSWMRHDVTFAAVAFPPKVTRVIIPAASSAVVAVSLKAPGRKIVSTAALIS